MKSITFKRPPDPDPGADDVLSVGVKVFQLDLLKVAKVDGGVVDLLLLGQPMAVLDDSVQKGCEESVGLWVRCIHPNDALRVLATCSTRTGECFEEGVTMTIKRTKVMMILVMMVMMMMMTTGKK